MLLLTCIFPFNICCYKHALSCQICCNIHSHSLSIYEATNTKKTVNLCCYIDYIPTQFLRPRTHINCQFMLLHALNHWHFMLLHTQIFFNLFYFILSLHVNICSYVHPHSLIIYVATYTQYLPKYFHTFKFIPCQFMLLHTLKFPFNLCASIQ